MGRERAYGAPSLAPAPMATFASAHEAHGLQRLPCDENVPKAMVIVCTWSQTAGYGDHGGSSLAEAPCLQGSYPAQQVHKQARNSRAHCGIFVSRPWSVERIEPPTPATLPQPRLAAAHELLPLERAALLRVPAPVPGHAHHRGRAPAGRPSLCVLCSPRRSAGAAAVGLPGGRRGGSDGRGAPRRRRGAGGPSAERPRPAPVVFLCSQMRVWITTPARSRVRRQSRGRRFWSCTTAKRWRLSAQGSPAAATRSSCRWRSARVLRPVLRRRGRRSRLRPAAARGQHCAL